MSAAWGAGVGVGECLPRTGPWVREKPPGGRPGGFGAGGGRVAALRWGVAGYLRRRCRAMAAAAPPAIAPTPAAAGTPTFTALRPVR